MCPSAVWLATLPSRGGVCFSVSLNHRVGPVTTFTLEHGKSDTVLFYMYFYLAQQLLLSTFGSQLSCKKCKYPESTLLCKAKSSQVEKAWRSIQLPAPWRSHLSHLLPVGLWMVPVLAKIWLQLQNTQNKTLPAEPSQRTHLWKEKIVTKSYLFWGVHYTARDYVNMGTEQAVGKYLLNEWWIDFIPFILWVQEAVIWVHSSSETDLEPAYLSEWNSGPGPHDSFWRPMV